MRTSRVHQLTIETPEGVSFAIELAGPMARGCAWFIDILIMAGIMLGINWALSILMFISADFAMALMTISGFVVGIGYFMFLEWVWGGQTIGKRLLKLRVVDDAGLKLRFGQILIRNLFRAVDQLPVAYGIGAAACFFSPRAQRLGDMVAGTVVVRYARPLPPDLEQLKRDKYNTLRDYPHIVARLRQAIGPAEAGIFLQALLDRDRLEAADRVALFKELAEFVREQVRFPEEAVFAMSDERFLRNVVDLLYTS